MGVENGQVPVGEGTGDSGTDGANGTGAQAPDGLDLAVAVESIGTDLFGESGAKKAESEASAEAGKTAADGVKPADGAPDPAAAKPADPSAPAAKPTFTPTPEQAHLFNEQGELRTWRKEAAAHFATLPPEVQQEILKREEDIFRGIEGYKADAAVGRDFQEVLAPYMPAFKQYNVDPKAQVGELLRYQFGFAFGTPEEKVALLQQIARDYQIDFAAAAASAPYIDPQVASLQRQLQDVQSRMKAADAAAAESRKAALAAEIAAFTSDPKNLYVAELVDDMARLLRSGAETSLEGAYKAAMWINPTVRAKELARQQAESEAAAKAEADAKAAAARKATSTNVRSTAKGGSAAAPLGSMDDTLEATLAAIRGRA